MGHDRGAPIASGTWRAGWALAGWVAGVALQLQQAALWPRGLLIALLLVGALALGLRSRLAWCLAGLLLAFASTSWRAESRLADRLPTALEGMDIAVVGRIDGLPQRGPSGERFAFAIEQASLAGEPVRLPARLLLSWYGGGASGWTVAHPSPGLRAGERWAFTVRLKRPHGHRNPMGFDREAWYWQQGYGATGYVRNGARDAPPQRLAAPAWHSVDRWRQAIVAAIVERLGERRAAGVLAALAVGEQSAIDGEDWALFRDTGVAHLMAISGLHITGFAWLATVLVGSGWRRAARRWPGLVLACPTSAAAAWGGVLLAVGYAVLAGWGVPAQRTVLMLAIAVGLRHWLRRWPWPALWLFTMAAVLALDPWAWLSAGFWLSFLAVAVLFAGDPARGWTAAKGAGWRQRLRPVLALWREQVLMTLALAPLTLVLFGQVSLVGLLANLLAIPWVTLVVTPLSLLGVALPWLWWPAAAAVDGLCLVLQWFAAWPGAVWHHPVPPPAMALAAVAGGALLALRWPPLWRAAGALLMLPALLQSPPRPAPGAFEVLALDVGQGSAVLVRTAHHALVYDSGPRWSGEADAGERIVLPLLRALGERPQRVVISHRDSDHAGGADALRAAFPDAIWRSSYDADARLRCRAGERWMWDGVAFELLHPPEADLERAGLSTNALSCVLRIAAGGHSAWLTGDIPAAQEAALVLSRPQERATLLLAPHHGSASSSSPVLLNTLRPRQVVVQSGYRNRYGHPAEAVLGRYAARGIPWVATPDCGAARWRSDAPDEVRCERAARRRYWHHLD